MIQKKFVWPALVVVILGSFVTFTLMAARIASDDPSFAIEPDYYQKAVTWDSTMAESRRTAALGWTVTAALSAIDANKSALLTLNLRDSLGAPVTNAKIDVEVRLVAHAGVVSRVAPAPTHDGTYAARVPFAHAGLAELRIIATRGTDRFSSTVRLDASTTSIARIEHERPGDAMLARTKAGARRESAIGEAPRTE